MMRSMFSGITGLRNFQTAMDIVGNNIANVNTVGFKASRISFQTTLSQLIKSGKYPSAMTGGTNPMQIGLGSQISSIDKIMSQGSFQNTGKKTDLAIQGDGFFILSNSRRYFYTRAGNFDLDMNGTLIQPSTGLKVQGWSAEVDPKTGKRFIDTNKPIGDIVISAGMRMEAKKTSKVEYDGNLKADVGLKAFKMTLKDDNNTDHEIRIWFTRDGAISDSSDPFSDNQRYIINIDTNGDGTADIQENVILDKFGNVVSVSNSLIDIDGTTTGEELALSTTGQLKFYEADDPTNFYVPEYIPPKYTTSVQVYDSLGNSYNLYIEFLKLGQIDATHKNVWIWRAYLPTGEPISYIAGDGSTVITGAFGGALNFDDSGRIIDYGSITGSTTSNVNWGAGNDVKYVQFDAGKNGDGIVKMLLDMARVTQFAGENSVAAIYQDGNALGILESFAINEVGEIIGTFSNGLTDVLGKIALAVFNNPAGLREVGNSLYVESANSGIAKIGEPGTGGRGTLIPGTLEMSNVDLAEEFTKMIIAQRGFQANARVITTSDQILNELVNIKR